MTWRDHSAGTSRTPGSRDANEVLWIGVIVCSNCEVVPVASAQSGAACAACGERLIRVDTADELVGTMIDGRFEVIAPLGRGGMGVVYRAKQLSIGREVAIKVLDRRIEKDVDAIKRFLREAKVSAALQHPNTVPIIDFGQDASGRLYLAMELINGRTLLAEVNATGAQPVARVAAIGIQLCDALEAAHDLQIVHRDLKLENAMLVTAKRDHVKVLDFGLARSLGDPTTAMTATGLISGTPRYMAPEVGLDGAPPAPSQDMYSLGVMLAELALGRPLWTEQKIERLFAQKLATEQSIAGVPAELRPLIGLLLSGEPGLRPTAAEARQLLRALDGKPGELDTEIDRPKVGLALEPTADIKVEVSTTPDPFAALDTLGTVSLDELPQAPSMESILPASIAPASPRLPVEDLDPRFSVPAGSEIQARDLHVDRAYLAERSAKLTARRAPPPAIKKTSKAPAVLLALLLLGGLGAGGYYWFYVRKPAVKTRLEGPGITITIEANGAHEISIDGKASGKTPVRLQVPKGTRPILITGTGLAPTQVVPDRDQTIVLEPTN